MQIESLNHSMAEYLDIVDENGIPTGETVERETAHAKGIRHRTVHLWLVRKKDGKLQVCCKDAPSTRSLFPIGTIRQARVIFRQAVITESRQFASFSRSLACTRKRKTLCTAARAAWCMTASFAASRFTTVRSQRCSNFGSTQMKALLTSTPPR